MILKELLELNEKMWSSAIHQKWTPPEGFFTKSASVIAAGLKDSSKDLKQAVARLNFYINRAGDNLSDKDKAKLELAMKKLHNLYEGVELTEAVGSVDEIISKLAASTGGSVRALHAIFVGGSAPGMDRLLSKLEKDGFDSAGAWVENSAWYKKHGVTKAEYNKLVKASL